jgi:RNA polymerase sigma factor (sigma-70 family)
MNETNLLQAFRDERSEEAFAALVRQYANLVYSIAKRRLANAAMAEDVTQMVFIRLAKTPPEVQSHGELVAWLHRTTLNVTIDTWRSETRRRNREQQDAVMETDTNSAWEEISPNLDQAVNQLADEDRQAILLRFFGEKTMRDIGVALGVSEAAAKMRVSRAVDRLRTQLGVGTACTAAVLGSLLEAHSVEAAPLQFVARLAAMRLPEVAGATAATGGSLSALSRIFNFKIAAGVAVVAIVGFTVAHFSRSNTPVSAPESEVSNATATTDNAPAPRQLASMGNSFVAPVAKPPKILLHVLDAKTGLGLPQTKVRIAYFGAGGQGEGHDMLTDENGDAPIAAPDDPTKDSFPNVFVTAEGHVPKVVSFGRVGTTNEYFIRLDPAITVGGFVVDERGVPVPGVTIFVQGRGNVSGQAENIDFQTCPVTNHEDGSWTCSYIPEDYTKELHLILKKTGYAITFPVISQPHLDLNNLLLVIDSGVTITGKITDEHAYPIANARIKVLDGNRSKWQTTHTDDDGVFSVFGVMGETEYSQTPPLETNATGGVLIRGVKGEGTPHVNLAVQAKGFACEMKTVQLSNATHVVNFALPVGNIFRGRVVDDLGDPIPNAVVQTDYSFSGGSERKFDWTTHTDANGVFEWDSAPAEKTDYWFEADGYEIIRDMAFVADGSEHEIVLKRKVRK